MSTLEQHLDMALDELVRQERPELPAPGSTEPARSPVQRECAGLVLLARSLQEQSEVLPPSDRQQALRRHTLEQIGGTAGTRRRGWVARRSLALVLSLALLALPTVALAHTDTGAGRTIRKALARISVTIGDRGAARTSDMQRAKRPVASQTPAPTEPQRSAGSAAASKAADPKPARKRRPSPAATKAKPRTNSVSSAGSSPSATESTAVAAPAPTPRTAPKLQPVSADDDDDDDDDDGDDVESDDDSETEPPEVDD